MIRPRGRAALIVFSSSVLICGSISPVEAKDGCRPDGTLQIVSSVTKEIDPNKSTHNRIVTKPEAKKRTTQKVIETVGDESITIPAGDEGSVYEIDLEKLTINDISDPSDHSAPFKLKITQEASSRVSGAAVVDVDNKSAFQKFKMTTDENGKPVESNAAQVCEIKAKNFTFEIDRKENTASVNLDLTISFELRDLEKEKALIREMRNALKL